MAAPQRSARFSQLWLPTTLFTMSVFSIFFSFRNDDLAVVGPRERTLAGNAEIDRLRSSIQTGLTSAGDWRSFCSAGEKALASLHFPEKTVESVPSKQFIKTKKIAQIEQDALIRCHDRRRVDDFPMSTCLSLSEAEVEANAEGSLLELNFELRSLGSKKALNCAEAESVHGSGVEMVAYYTYYWTRPGKFRSAPHPERLTGGIRIFPPHSNQLRPIAKSN
jgi:hypothetical protein